MKKKLKAMASFSNTKYELKYFLGLIALILMSSCESLINNSITPTVNAPDFEELQESYDSSLKCFHDSLVDHFPDLHDGNCLHYSTNVSTRDGCSYLRLVMKYPSIRIGEISRKAQNDAHSKSNIRDAMWEPIESSIPPQFNLYDKGPNGKEEIEAYPISNFNYCKELPQVSKGFYRNANVFLLGAGNINQPFVAGCTWIPNGDTTMYINENSHYCYSKGMAIHKRIVVYWIEIW